jgi:Zn-dependent protease with chaperone function/type II secretory pathway pseudopilin PulG
MDELVYPRERTLGTITLILGIVAWLALIVGTFGAALLFLLFGFVVYLFAQSALIAHIKGNGVELSERQFPDLYAQFSHCCERLLLTSRPRAFVMNGNGTLNAFATQFLGAPYVVLLSSVVDAMADNPDGVRFYMGHELGHLRMRHLSGRLLRWPVLWLPLLGAAYSRAKESTCDRHGAACGSAAINGARALSALSAGGGRWKNVDVDAYLRQAQESPGFWMSFHELIAGYPWMAKRFARVMQPNAQLPGRNGFAYLPALLVPYAGRLGGGFGFLILVYIVGVLAAIALPAYQSYTVRAKMEMIASETQPARAALAGAYESTHAIPQTLQAVGIDPALADGTHLSLNPKGMILAAETPHGQLLFVPQAGSDGHVTWVCVNGERLKPDMVPASCRTK